MAKRGRKPGFKLTEEHKQRIRESKLKSGFKHSEETKRKMSEAKIGKESPIKKKYREYEFGLRVSAGKKGKPLSEEHKQAMRKPKSVPSHRKGKKWLNVNGQRVWFTPREYQEYIEQHPDAYNWGNERVGMTWRVVDGKRTWMTKEEAKLFDLNNNIY